MLWRRGVPQLAFLASIFFLISLSGPAWGATTWLSGKVTAGGIAVKGAQCSLNPTKWESGKYYVSDYTTADANGEFSFKTVDNPSTACMINYGYGNFCNYSGAQCNSYCQEKEGRTVELSGYDLVCNPGWGSAESTTYARSTPQSVTINLSGSQSVTVTLSKKDKTLHLCLTADDKPVAAGFTCGVSGTTYENAVPDNSGCHDFLVAAGTYYASCYPTQWDKAEISCINSQSVEFKEGDTTKSLTLTGYRHNATIDVEVLDLETKTGLAGATINLNSADYQPAAGTGAGASTCYAYAYGITGADGKLRLSSIAGKRTLNVSPPYNIATSTNGTGYASATVPVTLIANETIAKKVALRKKDSEIKITFKDSSGKALQGANASIWANSETLNDWGWGQSGTDGVATLKALKGVRYNRSCSYWASGTAARSDIGHCPVEGEISLEAPTEASCTFPILKSNCRFSFVDATGNALPNVKGSATYYSAAAANGAGMYPTCSEWVSIGDTGSSTRSCPSASAMKADVYTWDSKYDATGTQSFTTGAEGTMTDVKIQAVQVNATISGKFVDQDGKDATPGSNYTWVSCSRNNIWKSCTMDSASAYSCRVSAGRWCCGYWIDQGSSFASVATGSNQNCVDVADSASVTMNMKLLKKATITGKVVDDKGDPKKWVWVTAASPDDDVKASDWMYYGGNGGSSNADGDYTMVVGASDNGTEYSLQAHTSWNDRFKEGLTLPKKVKVTCKAGETCKADTLAFRLMDGEFKVQVKAPESISASISKMFVKNTMATAADVAKGAFVKGYSSKCDSVQAEANDAGVAVIPCVANDVYQLSAMSRLGDKVYISEALELTCVSAKAVVADLQMSEAGNVPATVTKVCKDTDPCSATLSDGFSVNLPRNACGTSGNDINLSVQATVALPLQCEARPVGLYGYDTTVIKSDGDGCTQLQGEATICVPFKKILLDAYETTAGECHLAYVDRSTDSFRAILSAILDELNLKICGNVNHLTEFTIIGRGNIKAIDGDVESGSEQAVRTGETTGVVETVASIEGKWGEGVGVNAGDVSNDGKVASGSGDVGGDVGASDSSTLDALSDAGGCSLIPR